MAEPIVSFLLESIKNLLDKEVEFLRGVTDEAKNLHLDLKTMQAFLKDADEKQHERALVKESVSQCKDLAYEAENVLEDYAFKLASRRGKKDTFSVVKRYACILNEFQIRHNVGLEIQSLNTRISDLTSRFQKYGITAATEGEGSSSRQQQEWRTTYSYNATDEDFVGFGPDVEKLVEVLVKEDNSFDNHGVVSICGMGGCGKTTLARKVYNHPDVKSHFDSFAWVCISQKWQRRNVLQEILVRFLPDRRDDIQKWIDDEIVEQLARIQQEKKCLVVLDDIWSMDAWEDIKSAFLVGKKGNKILLTTRNQDVAMHIGPNGYHHQPKLLNDDESLELLMKKAFRNQPAQEYEHIKKEMVKSCGGLPLAVVILGGILATKHSYTEWDAVHKNIKSYLGKGEKIEQNQGEVQKILALSYSDLPYKLKPCFLYLSLFSEDERIEVDRLYNLWIAEGMVFTEDRIGDESMIEMADRYLGELAKRCIVTVEELGEYSHGRYSLCYLHDLMRDLCKAKAREEKFLEFFDYGHGNDIESANSVSSSIANVFPRVLISLSEEDAAKYSPIQLQEGSKHLRTFVFCATKRSDLIAQLAQSQINKFKMLRSLVIVKVITPGVENVKISKSVYKLPVGKLIHLRLLRLRFSELMMSPSSISNLEHLEIFDLRGSKIRWTKNVPIRMRRLKHLDLYGAESNFLTEIYVDNPNHLEVIYGLPSRSFDVRNLSEFTNIRDLGTIKIYDDEVKGLEKIFKCISKSYHLKHAIISDYRSRMSSQDGGEALLAQLFSSNVENIYLDGVLGKLPEYESHFLINLLSLELFGSEIEEDPMKILEKLPKLQRLEFNYHAFVGEEMVCHSGGLPQLRFLSFQDLDYFESWIVEKGAMPNLFHLEIMCCRKLQMIPEELRFVTPLKELVFWSMPEKFLKTNLNNFGHVPSIVVNGSQHQHVN